MLGCLLAAFYQFALFFFYFFYFLFKGKPEWQKIGNIERCTTNNCCLHNPKVLSEISSSGSPTPAKKIQTVDEQHLIKNKVKMEASWREGKETTATTTTTFQIFQTRNLYRQQYEQYANKAARTFHYFCSTLYGFLARIISLVPDAVCWLYSIICEWLVNFTSGTSTGNIQKPGFIQKTIAETFAEESQAKLCGQNQQQQQPSSINAKQGFIQKTIVQTNAEEAQRNQQQQQEQSSSMNALTEYVTSYDAKVTSQKESPVEEPIIEAGGFYSRKQNYERDFEQSTLEGQGIAVPPVLLPPTTLASIVTKNNEKVPPKGGVAVLPQDIMAEAHARVREREQKLNEQKAGPQENNEVNTDWTVTSKRFIPSDWSSSTLKVQEVSEAENKVNEEENETWKPVRRNVVSRIPRSSSDQDAQFIFRPPVHRNLPTDWLPEGSFLMGRSVFSPVREAEEMRNRVNRRLTETPSEHRFGSSFNTSLGDYTTPRITTPFKAGTYDSHLDSHSSYQGSRSRSQSQIHTTLSPATISQTHSPRRDEHHMDVLRQRSRTVEPRAAQGTVKALTRRWPPQSNATGVHLPKDNWNIIPSEIISCRRVMERSVTDKWTTRDENGDVIDEWSTRSWKGETDGLQRRNDGTGEVWHREVDISPHGKTSFVDNKRYYTRDYVIESEARNA